MSLHNRSVAVLPATATLVFALMALPVSAEVSPPNILFIMADDMGYGDVGVYNANSKIPTPNMDALAAEGMRFTDAHTASAVCSPTRYSVLTGRHAWRGRLKKQTVHYFEEPLIETDRLTVGEMLQNAGYATAAIGKWHLGLNVLNNSGTGFVRHGKGVNVDYSLPVQGGPIDYGFDYYFGKHTGPVNAFIENDQYVGTPVLGFLMEVPGWDEAQKGPIQLNKALDWIEAHHQQNVSTGTDQPFFMYYAPHSPHTPYTVPPTMNGIPVLGESSAGLRGDLVYEVDVAVGQVMDKLDALGIGDETLVIVSSDNGPELGANSVNGATLGHDAAGGWRGMKYRFHEGGHRVPFIARWGDGTPGGSVIPPGVTNDATIGVHDLMATAAELSGQTLPADAGEDSHSLVPLLTGDPSEYSRDRTIHQSATGAMVMREGDWKLIMGNSCATIDFTNNWHLYNLATDPGETTNLIVQQPAIVQDLSAKMYAELNKVAPNFWTSGDIPGYWNDNANWDKGCTVPESNGEAILRNLLFTGGQATVLDTNATVHSVEVEGVVGTMSLKLHDAMTLTVLTDVTVNAGGVLEGSGTIAGNVQNTYGSISPSPSPMLPGSIQASHLAEVPEAEAFWLLALGVMLAGSTLRLKNQWALACPVPVCQNR